MKKEEFRLTVKSNLRTFLNTQNYKTDNYAAFTVKEGNHRYYNKKHLEEKLEEELNREGNGCVTNLTKKVTNILSDENTDFDLFYVNEICELYKFPIEKIICNRKITPEEAEKIMEDISAKKHLPAGVIPLPASSHHSYFGEFYGYTIDHNPKINRTTPFKLHIYETESDGPIAEYSFYDANNKKKIFIGVPLLITERKAIAIQMTADNGSRYQYLYFNGKDYGAPLLTYKSGVCVRTSSASKTSEPDIKNFVITGYELSEETVKKYIPGLLKITGDDFYILKTDLDEAEANNPEIAEFRKEYEKHFVCLDKAVYMIEERMILSELEAAKNNTPRVKAFRCLTELKAFALASSRVTYRNAEADYSFFKELSNELNADKNQNDCFSQ